MLPFYNLLNQYLKIHAYVKIKQHLKLIGDGKNWRFVLLIGLFLSPLGVCAQFDEKKDSIIAAESFFKIRLGLNSGFMREQKVSKQSVIQIFAGGTLASSTDNVTLFNKGVKYIIEPNTYAEFRNYYNLQRRFKKNKKVVHNAADFF